MAEENIQNDKEQVVNPPNVKLDYIAARLKHGDSNATIADMKRFHNADSFFLPYDEFKKQYGENFKDEQKLSDSYTILANEYDSLEKDDYNQYASVFNTVLPVELAPNLQIPNDPLKPIYTPDFGVMQPYIGGPQVLYKSPDQIASSSGLAKDVDGTWKPLNELENAPGYLVRDLGNVQEGETPYIWRKLPEGELANGMELKSTFGDRLLESNGWNSFGRGFWSGTVPMAMKGIAGLVDFFESFSGNNDNPSSFVTNMYNASNYLTKQNLDEQQRWFEDWNSFLYNFGNGVGQLGTMVATSFATGGLASFLNIASASKISMQTGLLFGAFEAGGMMNEEGIKMGLDGKTRALMFAGFSLLTYASERIIPANIMQNVYGTTGRNILRKAFREEVGNLAEDATDKVKMKAGMSMFKKLMMKREGLKKIVDKSGFAGKGLGAGIEEGIEETAEGIMYMTAEKLYNMTQGANLQKLGIEKANAQSILDHFGTARYEKLSEDTPYIMTGKFDDNGNYIVDSGKDWKRTNADGSIDLISQAEYERNMDDLNHARKIQGKKVTYDAEFNWDEPVMAFFSSMATMGAIGGFSSIKGRQKEGQLNEWQKIAYKEAMDATGKETTKTNDNINNLVNNGEMGFLHLDPNGNVVQKGQGLSQGEINGKAVRAQIDYYKGLLLELGIKDQKSVNHVEQDENIIADVLKVKSELNQLNERKTQIANNEEVTSGEDITTSVDAAEIDALINSRINRLNYMFEKTETGYSELINDKIKTTTANLVINILNEAISQQDQKIKNLDIEEFKRYERFGDEMAEHKNAIRNQIIENQKKKKTALEKLDAIEGLDNVTKDNVESISKGIEKVISEVSNIGAIPDAKVRIKGAFAALMAENDERLSGIEGIDLEATGEKRQKELKGTTRLERMRKKKKSLDVVMAYQPDEKSEKALKAINESMADEERYQSIMDHFETKDEMQLEIDEAAIEKQAIDQMVADQKANWERMNQDIKNLTKDEAPLIEEDIRALQNNLLKFRINQQMIALNESTGKNFYKATDNATDEEGNVVYGNRIGDNFLDTYMGVYNEMMNDYRGEDIVEEILQRSENEDIASLYNGKLQYIDQQINQVMADENMEESARNEKLLELLNQKDPMQLLMASVEELMNSKYKDVRLPESEREDRKQLGSLIQMAKKRIDEVNKQIAHLRSQQTILANDIKMRMGEKGGPGPQKKVIVTRKKAIEETVSALKKKDDKNVLSVNDALRFERIFRNTDQIDYDGDPMYNRFEKKGYIKRSENGDYELTDKGKEFLDKINARFDTRKSVRKGINMFPGMANIPEFDEVTENKQNKLQAIDKKIDELEDLRESELNLKREMITELNESQKYANENQDLQQMYDADVTRISKLSEEYAEAAESFKLGFPALLAYVNENTMTVAQREETRKRGKIKLETAILRDLSILTEDLLKDDIKVRIDKLKEDVQDIHNKEKVSQEALESLYDELHNIKLEIAEELKDYHDIKGIFYSITEMFINLKQEFKKHNGSAMDIISYEDGKDTFGISEDDLLNGVVRDKNGTEYPINFFDLSRTIEQFVATRQKTKGPEVTSMTTAMLSAYMLKITNMINQLASGQYQTSFNLLSDLVSDYKDSNTPMPSIQQQEAINLAFNMLVTEKKFIAISKKDRSEVVAGEKTSFLPIFTALRGILVQGNGGAGKTSVMLDSIMKMLNKYYTDNKISEKKVLMVGQNATAAVDLKARFDNLDKLDVSNSLETADFIKKAKAGELGGNYDLIVIDEASRLSTEDVDFLLEYQKSHYKTRFLILGDVTQSNNQAEATDTNYAIPVFDYIARTSNVTENFRTGNFEIFQLQNAIDAAILSTNSLDIRFPKSTKYNASHTAGVMYRVNKAETISQWEKDQELEDASERILIFRTATEANDYISRRGLESAKNIRYIIGDTTMTVDDQGTIQGQEFPYIYAAFDIPKSGDKVNVYKDFKTAVTRGQEFVCCPATEISQESESVPSSKNLTGRRLEDRQKQIEELWNANKNWITRSYRDVKEEPVKKDDHNKTKKKKSKKKQTKPNDTSVKDDPKKEYEVDKTKIIYGDEVRGKEYTRIFGKQVVKGNGDDDGRKYVVRSIKEAVKVTSYVGSDHETRVSYHVVIVNVFRTVDGEEVLVDEVVLSEDEFRDTFMFSERETETEAYEVKTPVKETIKTTKPRNINDEENSVIKSRRRSIEKSAERFTDADVIPISIVTDSPSTGNQDNPENYFNKEFIDKKTNLAIVALSGTVKLVYKKGIDLYLNDGDINNQNKKNVNALLVYDENDNLLGSIYKPIMNEAHMERYLETGDNNIDPETINPNNVQFEDKAMEAYQKMIATIWQQAVQNGEDEFGSMDIAQINNGAAILREGGKNESIRTFLEAITAKGYQFKLRDDSWSNDPNDYKNAKVIQEKGKRYTTNYIEVSHASLTGYAEPQRIRVNNPPIKGDAKYQAKMNADLEALQKLADKHKAMVARVKANKPAGGDIGKLQREFNELFNTSEAFRALLMNKGMFYTNNEIKKEYRKRLELKDGFIDVKEGEGQEQFVVKMNNLRSLIADLITSGYQANKIKGTEDSKTTTSVTINDQEQVGKMTTGFMDIKMPTMEGLYNPNPKQGTKIPAGNVDNANVEDFDFLRKDSNINPNDRVIREDAKAYIRDVLGVDVSNNQLEFVNDATREGIANFGHVSNLKIILEQNGYGVLRGVAQHEAVHYVMKYLVSPGYRSRVLGAVKRYMSNNGYGVVTDKDAEEFLAEANRLGLKFKMEHKGLKKYVYAFIDWISKLFSKVIKRGHIANRFLDALNNGEYRDRSPRYNNYDHTAFMANESTEAHKKRPYKEGPISKENLTRIFGGASMLNRITNQLKRQLVYNSSLNRDYTKDYNDVKDAITLIYDSINSRYGHIKDYDFDYTYKGSLTEDKEWNRFVKTKLSNQKIYNSVMSLILPEFNFTSQMIEQYFQPLFDKENETPAVEHSLSAVSKLIIDIIPLNHYQIEGNKIFKTGSSQAALKRQALEDILIKAANMSKVIKEGQTGMNPIERWLDNVIRIAKEGNRISNNEETDIALSFVEFFSDKMAEFSVSDYKQLAKKETFKKNKTEYSYFSYAFNIKKILKAATGMEKEALEAAIEKGNNIDVNRILSRHKKSQDLLNAMYHFYGSLQKMDYINTKMVYTGNGIQFVPQNLLTSSEMEMRQQMKSHIEYIFQDFGKGIKSRIGPNGKLIKIEANSLTWKPNNNTLKEEILSYISEDGKGRWVWNTTDTNTINMVLNSLGLNSSWSLVKHIKNNPNDPMNMDRLANFIGSMADMLMNNYKAYGDGDIGAIFEERLKMYFGSRTRTIDSAIVDEETQENINIYSLLSFDDEIKDLARVRAKVNANVNRNFNKQPEGGKTYTNVLANALADMLTNNEDVISGKVLKQKFKEVFDNLNEEQRANSPFAYKNSQGKWVALDPLLASELYTDVTINIERINFLSGISSDYTGVNIGNMTEQDYWNNILYGHYAKSVSAKNKTQHIFVPLNNMADSKMFPVVKMSYGDGTQKLFQIDWDGNTIKGASINNELLNKNLDKYFELRKRRMDQSINRWMNLEIKTRNGEEQKFFPKSKDLIDLQKRNGRDKYVATLEFLQSKLSTIKENKRNFVQQLIKAGLTEGIDFRVKRKIVDGVETIETISLGYDTVMNASRGNDFKTHFNFNNYWKWRGVSDEKKTKLRNDIFKTELNNFIRKATENYHNFPKAATIFGVVGKRPMIARKQKNGEFVANPFYEAFYFSHMFVSDSLWSVTAGMDNQFKSSQDLSVRGKAVSAQGLNPVTGNTLGLSENINVIKVRDVRIQDEKLNKQFGLTDTWAEDGLIYVPKIFAYAYNGSTGREFALQTENENTYKTIRTGVNLANGQGEYIKSSIITLNNDFYEHNPILFDKLMRFMLTGKQKKRNLPESVEQNLYNVYLEAFDNDTVTSSQAQKKVYDYIVKIRIAYGVDLMDNMIMKIENHNSNKITTQYLNEMTLDEILDEHGKGKEARYAVTQEKSGGERFILNANQSVDNPSGTDPTQIKFITGHGDHNKQYSDIVQAVDTIRAIRKFREFLKEFDGKSRDEVLEALRRKGKGFTRNISGMTALMEMINNKNVSMDIPSVKGMLLPTMVNMLNDCYGQDVPSLKMVQAPGDRFMEYHDIETEYGIVTATEKDINLGLFQVDGNNKKRKMGFYKTNGSKITQVAEVAMPFVYLKQFGINPANRYTLNQILNIEVDGENLNVRAFLKQNCKDYYKSKEDGFEALRALLTRDGIDIGGKTFLKMIDRYSSPEALIEYYKVLIDTLDIVAIRIPTSELALGMVGEITSITYDSGSTIYSSALKTLLDNSDYDIDQLSVMFRKPLGSIDKNNLRLNRVDGIKTSNDVMGLVNNSGETAMLNSRFDAYFDMYLDSNNLEDLMNPLVLDEEAEIVEKLRKESKNKLAQNDPATNLYNFIAAHTGTKLVGYFANAERVFSTLFSLSEDVKNNDDVINPMFQIHDRGLNETDESILKILSVFVQLSVDNKKLAYLHDLKINNVSAPLIVAMAMGGVDKKMIYEILQNKEVSRIINNVKQSQSMGSRTLNLRDEVMLRLNQLIAFNDDANILEKREYIIKRIQKQIDTLNDKITDLNLDKNEKEEQKNGLKDSDGILKYDDYSNTYVEAVIEEELSPGELTPWEETSEERRTKDDAIAGYASDIVALEKKIKALKSISDDKYIEQEQKKYTNNINALHILKNTSEVGEFIKRLSIVFSMTENVPVNEQEIFVLKDNLEFWSNMDIIAYANGERNYRINKVSERAEALHDYNENRLIQPSQGELNEYTNRVMNKALELAQKELKDLEITVKGISGGQTGFDESGIDFFENNNIPFKVILPKKGKYRNDQGLDNYDQDNERFPGADVEYMENERYAPRTRKVITNSDVVVDFVQYEESLGAMLTKKTAISKGKEYVRISDINTDEDTYLETASKIAASLVRAAKSKQVEMEKALKGKVDSVTIRLNIAGNDIGVLNNPVLSERKAFLEFESKVRKYGDIGLLIENIPHVNTVVKQFAILNEVMSEAFYSNSEFFSSLRDKAMKAQQLDNYTYKDFYYALYQELNNAIIDHHYGTSINKVNFAVLAKETGLNDNEYLSDEFTGKNRLTRLDLSDYYQRVEFAYEFIEFINRLKLAINTENEYKTKSGDGEASINANLVGIPASIANNIFLNRLEVEKSGLGIANETTITAEEVDILRDSFSELPYKLKRAFIDYNLLWNGFSYGAKSLNNYLGDKMAEVVSSSVEKFARELFSPGTNALKEDMLENFINNAIVKNQTLQQKETKGKIRTPLFKVKKEGTFVEQLNKKVNWHDQTYMYIDGKYEKVYRETTNTIKSMPIDRTIVSRQEVYRPTNLDIIRQVMRDEDNIEINFNFFHGFKEGQNITVMGKQYVVDSTEYYSMTISKLNKDHAANKDKEWKTKEIPNKVVQGNISKNKIQQIKPGVKQLFENNPELANEVYKILGFNLELSGNKKRQRERFVKKDKRNVRAITAIEQWKVDNDIKYNANEVFSRNQKIYSEIGRYAIKDIEAYLNNIVDNIKRLEGAGFNMEVSAYTGNRFKLTTSGIRFEINPNSEDIIWASAVDVSSSQVQNATKDLSKYPISFTKAPKTELLDKIEPNLANVVNKQGNKNNELAIKLRLGNFKIVYDNDVDINIKKQIDAINEKLSYKEPKLSNKQIEPNNNSVNDILNRYNKLQSIDLTKIEEKFNYIYGITTQQKKQAQQLYSQYLEQGGKEQNIKGFKEFVNKQNVVTTKIKESRNLNALKSLGQFHNMNNYGFMPKTIINTNSLRFKARNLGFGLKQATTGDWYFTLNGRKVNPMRSPSIALGIGEQRLAAKSLEAFVDYMKTVLPGLEIRIVNDTTTAYPGLKGYVSDGVIYYNSDRVTDDTPMHELGHILYPILKIIDPELYQLMVKDAIRELEAKSPLAQKVKETYSDLGYDDLIEEIAITKFGLTSAKKVKDYVPNNLSYWETIKNFIKRIWDRIKDFFKASNVDINKSTEYKNMIDKIVTNINNGVYNLDTQRLAFEMSKIKESRNLNDRLESLSDLEGALLLYEIGDNMEEYLNKQEASRIYNQLVKQVGDKIYRIGEEKWDFTKDFEETDPRENVIKRIQKDIVPYKNNFRKEFPTNLVEFLDHNGANGSLSNEKAKGIKKVLSNDQIKAIKYYTTWRKGDKVVQYKDLKALLGHYDNFSDIFDEAFDAANTIFIIHKLEFDGNTITSLDVSLYDINSDKIYWEGLNNSNSLITGNLITDEEAASKGVSLQNNLIDVKKLQLGLLALKLKDKNRHDIVKLRRIGVVEATKNSIDAHPVHIDNIIHEFKALRAIEPFYSILPLNVQEVLSNDVLMSLENYHQDYFDMLLHNWQVTREAMTPVGQEIMDERIGILKHYIDNPDNETQLLAALRAQQKYIQSARHLNDIDRMEKDDEMRFISNVIFEMKSISKKSQSRTKQINYWQYLANTQPAISNWVLENFSSEVRDKLRIITYNHRKFMKEMNDVTKKHIANLGVKEFYKDQSHAHYNKFFIKEEIDGVETNLMRVHWTLDDPRTRKAFSNREITQEDLVYGKYIAEQSEKFIKQLLRGYLVNNSEYYNKDGSLKTKEINKKVEQLYNENWEKGMLPVISKDPVESASGGDIKHMFSRFFAQTKQWEAIYDDMFILTGDNDNGNRMASMFMRQITNNVKAGYGNKNRMKQMGIEEDKDGNIRVFDANKNKQMSNNIFAIMRYLAMDAMSKEVLEQEVLPFLDNAYTVARTLEITEGKDQTMVKKWLKTWSDSVVLGKRQQTIPNKKEDDKLSGAVNLMLRVTTFSGVALSVPVGIVSASANTVEGLITAIGNSIGNPNEVFTMKDWLSAGKIYLNPKNAKLIQRLADEYQIYESDRGDMLSNPKYDPKVKHVWTSNVFQGPNRITDLETRKLVMIAQMLHEGTFHAHFLNANGYLEYDAKKDKRFFTNGNQTEVQKILYEGLIEDLKKDGLLDQDAKKPNRAYSIKEERRIEFVANEFVVGTFNKEAQAAGHNLLVVKAIGQFRKFLNSKIQTRLGKYRVTPEGGRWIVENVDGKLERVWKGFESEGSWSTAASYIPYVNSLLEKLSLITKKRSLKDLRNMSELEKLNLARAMLDVVFALMIWMITMGFDEDDLGNDGLASTIAAMKRGMATVMATGPASLAELATNIPLLTFIKRAVDILSFEDVDHNLRYFIPGRATGEFIYDTVNN